MKNEIDELEDLISNILKEESDSSVSWFIEEIEDISVLREIEDEWIDDGKYSYGTFICMIQYKDNEYVLEFSQSRSGSYHTDYYYDPATLDNIQLATEYFAPKPIYSFNYKNKTVVIFKDEIKVDSNIFKNVELAIDFIQENN